MSECHVFFAPHTDDETIGMGGSMARAIASESTVVVVLVTDNQPSAHMRDVFAWYDGDLAATRLDEMAAALRSFGGVFEWRWSGIPEQLMCDDRRGAIGRVVELMTDLRSLYSGDRVRLTFHTVVGEDDPHAETNGSNLAHRICELGARGFGLMYPHVAVELHKVYVYSQPIEARMATVVRQLTDDEMAAKRRAIECYKTGAGRIGYGYRSVPELFDGAASDPREFIERL